MKSKLLQHNKSVSRNRTNDVVNECSPFDNTNSRTVNSTTFAPIEEASVAGSATEGGANVGKNTKNGRSGHKPGEKIQIVEIGFFKTNPRNVLIYGEEKVDTILQNSLLIHVFQEPLVVDENFMPMAEHRRLKAVEAAGIMQVPVLARKMGSKTDKLVASVESNRQRIKDNLKIRREAKILLKIEAALAAARKARDGTVKGNPDQAEDVKPLKGKSRDLVGKKIGLSGVSTPRSIEVVKAVDKLKNDGTTAGAKALCDHLNKSIDAGYTKAVETGALAKTMRKPEKAKRVETKPTAKRPAPKLETSPYENNDYFPLMETHADAMNALESLTAYVEGLTEADVTKGRGNEWRESLQNLTWALKDAQMID
jgi:hypothetical protein